MKTLNFNRTGLYAWGRNGDVKQTGIAINPVNDVVLLNPVSSLGKPSYSCTIKIPNEDRARVGFAIMGENPLTKIDWSQLKGQKADLMDMIAGRVNKTTEESLQGLLCLVNALQGYCADTLNLPVEFLME